MKKGLLILVLMSISACSSFNYDPIDVNVEPNEEMNDSKADPMAGNNERIINEARQDGKLERN